MGFKRMLSLLLCSLTLGCTSTPKIQVVEKYEQVIIKTPSDLLEPVTLPEPPAKDTYILAKCSSKETMLTDYSISLLDGLDKCNTRIKAIKTFQDKATTIQKDK